MTAHLVAATPLHGPALATIHASAFPPRERWGADAMALQLDLPGAFGFLDPAGGLILARVAADEAEILTLAVAPALRRQGRGRALLAAAERRAAALGAAAMFLEVASGNAAAQALYGASGYAPVGRRPNYYGPGSDALLLRRALNGGAATGE